MLGLVRPLFARLKSLASTPVTLSLNVTAKLTLVAFVEQALVGTQLMDETVGAIVSFVTVVDAEPVLPTASVTQTRIVLAPSANEPAAMLVGTVLGCVL